MTTTKPRTRAQLDRATDLRLQKTYGITLAEYNLMLAGQGMCCKICRKPPTGRRLHVDHDHGWKKVKISAHKRFDRWGAFTAPGHYFFVAWGQKKQEAVKKVRQGLLRASVRGLLCAWCNRGLRFYKDNPEFMENAAKYLREHQRTDG